MTDNFDDEFKKFQNPEILKEYYENISYDNDVSSMILDILAITPKLRSIKSDEELLTIYRGIFMVYETSQRVKSQEVLESIKEFKNMMERNLKDI